jgi:hypothetical protein
MFPPLSNPMRIFIAERRNPYNVWLPLRAAHIFIVNARANTRYAT